MPTFGSRFNNVTTFTVATMVAYGFAFLVVGSLLVMTGAEEARAPFLLTLVFATLASCLVGAVTTTAASRGSAAQLAEQRGNAAFAFSNSSGTFITLVTAAAECWESHAPKTDTGLALLLAAFGITEEEAAFGWYFGLLVALSATAFCFVVLGASRLNRDSAVNPTGLQLVRLCSVCLLVIGLAAGTPWGVIPYGAREVADIWSTIGWTAAFLASVAFFAAVLSYGFGAFVSLLANGLIHLGVSLKSLSAGHRFRKALQQFGVGCLWVVGLFLVSRLLLAGLRWALGQLTSVPPHSYEPIIDALTRALATSAAAVFLTGAILALILSCVLLWPTASRLAVHVWGWFKLRWSNARAALILLGHNVATWCISVISALRQFRLRLAWPNWTIGHIPRLLGLSLARLAKFTSNTTRIAWDAARDFGLAHVPRGPITRSLLAGTSAILLTGSFVLREEPATAHVDLAYPLLPMSEPVLQPVELDVPMSLTPPPLDDVHVKAVSICELSAGTVDWVSGSDDKFEIPLERCLMPSGLQESRGALVLVGLASSVGETEREDRRALSRGIALASWAYRRLPNRNDLYVLHFGTAQRDIPLRRYQDLFGDVVGERPVAGLLITPEPEDATMYGFDVAEELSNYMVRRGVADEFSRCALYIFRAEALRENQLELVEHFDCRSREGPVR